MGLIKYSSCGMLKMLYIINSLDIRFRIQFYSREYKMEKNIIGFVKRENQSKVGIRFKFIATEILVRWVLISAVHKNSLAFCKLYF